MDKKILWMSKNLGTQATNLAFSPEGGFLIIGLVNGVTLVLDCKIEQLPMGIMASNYKEPTLTVLMNPKEANSGCLGVRFSYRGDFLAISFNNETVHEENTNEAKIGQPDKSFVDGFRDETTTMGNQTF